MLPLAALLPGCELHGPKDSENETEPWPAELFGRKLRSVSDNFVLYAKNEAGAAELRSWVGAELATFASRYRCQLAGKGIVVAIEAGDDPSPVLEDWRRRNVDRSRAIDWTSPIRDQTFHTHLGRPYALFDEVYFRESFAIPIAEAGKIGCPHAVTSQARWICLLTTDGELLAASTNEIRKRKELHEEELARVPVIVRLLSARAEPLWALAQEHITQANRNIDLSLMHLQRRETLWEAILQGGCTNTQSGAGELTRLRDEIDNSWKELWVRRKMD